MYTAVEMRIVRVAGKGNQGAAIFFQVNIVSTIK